MEPRGKFIEGSASISLISTIRINELVSQISPLDSYSNLARASLVCLTKI